MRRPMALLLAVFLMISLTACGGSGQVPEQAGQNQSEPAASETETGPDKVGATQNEPAQNEPAQNEPVKLELPDFAAFSNGYAPQDGDRDDRLIDEGRVFYYYNCTTKAGDVLVPEYVSLLTESGDYILRGSFSNPDEQTTYYWFSYDGEGEVTDFSLSLKNTVTNGLTLETGDINLFLADIDYTHIGYARQLTFHVSPELELADPGVRTTYIPAPEPDPVGDTGSSSGGGSSSGSSGSSGSSSSSGSSGSSGSAGSSSSSGSSGSSSSSSSSDRWMPCTKCHGSGTVSCSRCGGSGGKMVYTHSTPNYSGSTHFSSSSGHWENCSKCHGSGETTCTKCDGSGRQSY